MSHRGLAQIGMMILALLVMVGCDQNLRTKVRVTGQELSDADASTDQTPMATPTVEDGLFFQLGGVKSEGRLEITSNFADSFFLRGALVHAYLGQETHQQVHCLVARFDTLSKVLVLPASPQSIYNFTARSREYYFQILSQDRAVNQSLCQDQMMVSGMMSDALLGVDGHTFVYTFADLSTQTFGPHNSESVVLYNENGQRVEELPTSYLSFTYRLSSQGPSSVARCSTSTTCRNLGYDCCLDGQCVRDRTQRSDVDANSQDFYQAMLDIERNPSNIYRYPHIFNLCAQVPRPTPVVDDGLGTPIADEEFSYLKELYECTTRWPGSDFGICTLSIDEASRIRGTPQALGSDDLNFASVYMGTAIFNLNNIFEVIYAGETLYSERENLLTVDPSRLVIDTNTRNDNLTDAQLITLMSGYNGEAIDDILKLKYKVDGSCRVVSGDLVQCAKKYVQNQNLASTTDHPFNSDRYYLPYYADLSRTVQVTVDGFQTTQEIDWVLGTDGAVKYITFIPYDTTTLQGVDIYDQQEIEITYYVNNVLYPVMQAKLTALEEIKERCECFDTNCSLKPYLVEENGQQVVRNYICDYPTPVSTEQPLQVFTTVNTKSIPLRLYDAQGNSFDDYALGTPVPIQEGNAFSYVNGDYRRPNTVFNSDEEFQLAYVGANEVYGSIDYYDAQGARPPTMVEVKEGRTYDVFVNNGAYSPCPTCMTDYYSLMNRIFPQNFRFMGGGYRPDPNETNRWASDYKFEGNYRSDDLLFGRACFVPMTMIPWSHRKKSYLREQRQARLMAQHFLFANGYQRDWYGFDYGALIGSFDGVTWFAVGNERRVKAQGNRLFLAINGYAADLATSGSFSVTVKEATLSSVVGTVSTNDLENDGAECQKYHLCELDVDCVTQLGWDYSCQDVSEVTTSWPYFDVNGKEIPNTERTHRLVNLVVGGVSGSTRRCVYRGRGAPCHANYFNTSTAQSYAASDSPGLNGCVANDHCQSFYDSQGNANADFNLRIARFAAPPSVQNDDENNENLSDLFGLGAKILGRPYNYWGSESVDADLKAQLSYNKITAICLPGRDPTATTLTTQHSSEPASKYRGDKILNIGITRDSNLDDQMFSSCPILDTEGNYLHFNSSYATTAVNDSVIKHMAGQQILSTKALERFDARLYDDSDKLLTYSSETSRIDDPVLEKNRCLRAPTSPCFTDLDCGPSSFISDKIDDLDESWFTNFTHELTFWKEPMICGNVNDKTSSEFDIRENHCCREIGNILTIESAKLTSVADSTYSNFYPNLVGGLDISYASNNYYSRNAANYYYMHEPDALNSQSSYTPLVDPKEDLCGDVSSDWSSKCKQAPLVAQNAAFLNLHKMAAASCCSGHWVRNFAESNGGGDGVTAVIGDHQWSASKMQADYFENFKCLAWGVRDASMDSDAFSCTDATANCNARNLSDLEASYLNDFFSSLELLGIPQVMIKSTSVNLESAKQIGCFVDPDDDSVDAREEEAVNGISYQPVPNTIKTLGLDGTAEYYDSSTSFVVPYYSAGDLGNFATEDEGGVLRQIFSPDKFTCCYPTGEVFDFDVSNTTCCSGQVSPSNSRRCCLPDGSNVTIYLNRYVSSEAAYVDSSRVDPLTGSLSPAIVWQIAEEKQICCSGNLTYGTAVSDLPVPGDTSGDSETRKRFLYLDTDSNVLLFKSGRRWNTNVYCGS